MNKSFTPRIDVLPWAQKELWPALRPSTKYGLVLYGGTAIALRLGHRVSVDFDFFTNKPLDKAALYRSFPFLKSAQILQNVPNTLTASVPGSHPERSNVKVSFFGGIGFGRVGNPERTQDGAVEVASLEDLMATKVAVIQQRVTLRDYQDIAAIMRSGAVRIERGLAAARAIYGPAFQASETLKALVYFEGGDLQDLSVEDRKLLVQAVSRVRDIPRLQVVSRSLSMNSER